MVAAFYPDDVRIVAKLLSDVTSVLRELGHAVRLHLRAPAFVAATVADVRWRHEQQKSARKSLLDEPLGVVEIVVVGGGEVVVVREGDVPCDIGRARRMRGEFVLDELDDERIHPATLSVVQVGDRSASESPWMISQAASP